MSSPVLGLRVAATVFGIVMLGHFVRLTTQLPVFVAGYDVPLWVNALGALFAGGLSLWMVGLAYRARDWPRQSH
jgi:hypothetical protein